MSKKILIIDDEPDIVEILKQRLEVNGYEVLTTFGGLNAIEKMKEEKPDLVTFNLCMPDIDGYEVCKKIGEDLEIKDIFIIIIISDNSYGLGLAEKCIGTAAVVDYIIKPYDPEKLLKKIEALIGE